MIRCKNVVDVALLKNLWKEIGENTNQEKELWINLVEVHKMHIKMP